MGALLDGAVPLKQPAQMNLVNRELVYRGNYSAAVAMHIGAKHQFKSCAFRWLCVSNRIAELLHAASARPLPAADATATVTSRTSRWQFSWPWC